MIIVGLLNVIYGLVNVLTSVIDIPNMPPQVSEFIEQALEYISLGASIFANYCHFDYLFTLFGIVISIDVGIVIYKFVMWIIRKLPISSE